MLNNGVELITIDRRSNVKVRYQIQDNIKALILDRTFYYQTVLPNPSTLASYLDVPVKKVENAYQSLINERLVSKEIERYIVSYIELTNYFFTRNTTIWDAIISLGLTPAIKCIEKTTITIDDNTMKAMGFEPNDSNQFFYINRLYYGNNHPIILLENYLPLHIFPGIDKEFQGEEPLDKYIGEHYGFTAHVSKRIIKAVNLTKKEAGLLKERVHVSSIQSTNKVYDESGRMIDFGRSHAVSSYYFQELITKEELDLALNSID